MRDYPARQAAIALILCASGALAAEKRAIAPRGMQTAGPYSPGIMAGDFLYVSGQGAKNAAGEIAPDMDGQLRQCFENVKTSFIFRLVGLVPASESY